MQEIPRGPRGNLVGLPGYYVLVAMTLNTFGMRAQEQTDLPFAE